MSPIPPKKKQGIANYNQSKGKIPVRIPTAQQKLLDRRPVK